MRSVSLLSVRHEAVWNELAAAIDLAPYITRVVDPLTREVNRAFDAEALPALRKRGIPVLVRYAQRTEAELQAVQADLEDRIAHQPRQAQVLLFRAQRHARDGVVLGSRV